MALHPLRLDPEWSTADSIVVSSCWWSSCTPWLSLDSSFMSGSLARVRVGRPLHHEPQDGCRSRPRPPPPTIRLLLGSTAAELGNNRAAPVSKASPGTALSVGSPQILGEFGR